jgi:signal transduction histidine kinase
MAEPHPLASPPELNAYAEYERQIAIKHSKVGCLLVICLMPAGAVLDLMVYPGHAMFFFKLRVACTVLECILWGLLYTRLGPKFHHLIGLVVITLPLFFMSWMIYHVQDPASPYYAGLNLILLGVAFVLRWDVALSMAAIFLTLGFYLAACLSQSPISGETLRGFGNNLYFLVLTGVIVFFGSLAHRRLREREFRLRYALDRNREELESTNRKLVEMDQIKSRFFANISHELRTPLTLLLAPLETLQHRRGDLSEGEIEELLGSMFANGMRLLKLINDLLELVRLDAGIMQVRLEPVELVSFLRGLASAARQVAADRQLCLETMIAPEVGRVMVDRDKLEKIVLNLQFNALKFTPTGGRVDIQAGRQGEELVIEVKDTGVGISEQNLPSVFSRFWQADTSARRKYQGAGIGLALVKELTELQGGTVAVRSQEGKGTTFTVRLPFVPAGDAIQQAQDSGSGQRASTAPAGGSSDGNREEWLVNLYRRAEMFPAATPTYKILRGVGGSTDSSRPKVLIADDEPDMLGFLRMQLQDHYQVLQVLDGAQAVEETTRSLPDLILLDMMMPEKDGLQVCRELRDQPQTRGIPIVMITARADEETKMAALSAGANDFLPKPFSTTELHARVKNLIETGHFQRRLARQNERLEEAIDQLKETEAQLVQTEKLASLGRMSAGIIHEINNPLNYAKTGLYTLRQHSLSLPAEQRACFEDTLAEVEDGVNRVKNIVLELGPFTRQVPDAYDECEVGPMVETALRLLSHEWKDNKVAVERALPAGLTAWVNPPHVIQVLVNLLQNALDALKQKEFTEGGPAIRITGWVDHDHCLLAIRDNGPGIQADIMPKIFEPFFTTKDVGAGMGLGLNICYRIMQAHHGRITAKSEPGQFCEFTLEFPVKELPAEAQDNRIAVGL